MDGLAANLQKFTYPTFTLKLLSDPFGALRSKAAAFIKTVYKRGVFKHFYIVLSSPVD